MDAFKGIEVVRDGYQTYYSNVTLNKPVGLNPVGYKFMEAIRNDSTQQIKFVNYGTFEHSTVLQL